MLGLNKVTLIGNPGIKMLEGNIKVAKFSLATTESYKDKDGNVQSETEWHNVVAQRTLSDLTDKYLQKGSRIYLEGKLKTRSYEDKEGTKKYLTEIIAGSFIMPDKGADKAEINASF
jgi:single-strand DNA-binding protein